MKSSKRLYLAFIFVFLISLFLAISRLSILDRTPLNGFSLDAMFCGSIVTGVFALLGAIRTTPSYNGCAILTVLVALFSSLLRCIPNLRLDYPPLHDPYYYVAGVRNISEFGTITPMLPSWFPDVGFHLQWPTLQLLASFESQVAGTSEVQILRFFTPFLTSFVLTFSVFLLAYRISNTPRIAAMSALIAGCIDALVFYQSEFHPQGLAISISILFLFFVLKASSNKSSSNVVVLILLTLALVMTHHFTSILMIAIFASMMTVSHLMQKSTEQESTHSTDSESVPRKIFWRRMKYTWLMVFCFSLSYNMIIGLDVFRAFYALAKAGGPVGTLATFGESVPISATILGLYKWMLLLLAIPYLLKAVRSPRGPRNHYLVLLIAILIVAIGIQDFLTGGPTDRLIAYVFPLIAIPVSASVLGLGGEGKRIMGIWRSRALIIITGLLCSMSVFNAQIPAIYFDTAHENVYYWYSDNPSTVNVYGPCGGWLREHTSNASVYATEFDTRVLPFYYAQRNFSLVEYYPRGIPALFEGYVVLNPTIPYVNEGFNKVIYIMQVNTLYSDGTVIVGGTFDA